MVFHVVRDLDDYYRNIMDKQWANRLIICYFTASWCGPCKAISPDITTLGEKSDSILVLKVDVDECDEVSAQCEIDCMPTFRFHVGNSLEPSHKLMGADKNKLFNIVGEMLGKINASQTQDYNQGQDYNQTQDRNQVQDYNQTQDRNQVQDRNQGQDYNQTQDRNQTGRHHVRKNTEMDMPFLYNPIPDHKFNR